MTSRKVRVYLKSQKSPFVFEKAEARREGDEYVVYSNAPSEENPYPSRSPKAELILARFQTQGVSAIVLGEDKREDEWP